MKITGVRTRLYEFEMARPIGDANNPAGRKHSAQVAVFVDTDEGLTGVSLGASAAQGHIHTLVNNLLVGRDPRRARALEAHGGFRLQGRQPRHHGRRISAIDIALWDLKAKANGEPLWKTLGASTRRVKAYASGIDLCLTDEELRIYYEGMARRGSRPAN